MGHASKSGHITGGTRNPDIRQSEDISNLFEEDEDSKLGQERIRVGHRGRVLKGVGKIVEMEGGRLYCMKENMIDKFINCLTC